MNNDAQVIDLQKLVSILLDNKKSIALSTVLFTALGVGYAMLATPVYKADAMIQVEEKSSGMSSLIGDMGEMFASESKAATEIALIKSRMVLGQTVDSLNLTTVVEYSAIPLLGEVSAEDKALNIAKFDVPIGDYQLTVTDAESGKFTLTSEEGENYSGTIGQVLVAGEISVLVDSLSAAGGDVFKIAKISEMAAIERLKQDLSVAETGKQTGILNLSMVGADKQAIEARLQSIVDYYVSQNIQRNAQEAQNSLEFLQQHLPEMQHSLNRYENALNQYRQDNESIDLGLEAKTTLDTLVAVETQLNELTFKESEISQRFTKSHPAYIALMDKRAALVKERQRLNAHVKTMPETQREILRLTRDVEVNQNIYVSMLNKAQELSVMKASTVGNVRQVDEARAYDKAIKPKKALIVLASLLFGGFLGSGIALVRAAMTKGIQSNEEVEALGLSVFANIPKSDWQTSFVKRALHRKTKENFSIEQTLLAVANPADISIEAIRSLRASLHFAMLGAKNNVIGISGPAPGVGKSFVSANLAAAIAQSGKKVLLIDADLRKGYLQRSFALDWDNGLSDYLSAKQDISVILKTTAVSNLDLITRGKVPPNPAELLMQASFKALIEWAEKHYDLVIIDTPPILAVADAAIVGDHIGTMLMVGRFGATTSKEIDVASTTFAKTGINIKGVIVNCVEQRSCGYEYYRYEYK